MWKFSTPFVWLLDWVLVMDVERSSLCNCVVNFLLEENYLLTAFELLHELLDDGRDAQAIRLKEFFCNPAQFPPDQISRFNSLRGTICLHFPPPPVFWYYFWFACLRHFLLVESAFSSSWFLRIPTLGDQKFWFIDTRLYWVISFFFLLFVSQRVMSWETIWFVLAALRPTMNRMYWKLLLVSALHTYWESNNYSMTWIFQLINCSWEADNASM